MRSLKITLTYLWTILFTAVLSSPLYADVTVERFIKSSGIGGMGASEIQEKESIKGLKKKTDSKRKFTGKILGRLTKEKETSTIFRVDKDLIWYIDHSKKAYRERPISLPEDVQSSAFEEGEEEEIEAVEGEEKEPEVRIIKNEFKVEKTGKEKTINGYPCKQYVLTWLLETENVKTKERNTSLMTSEFWNAEEDEKIRAFKEEEEAFNRAYLQKLGLDITPIGIKQFGLDFLGAMAGAAGAGLKKEMSKMKGYPIVTSVKWESETDESGKEVKEEAEEVEIDISRGLGGALGGFLKKKLKKPEKKKKPVFESYVEIKRIDTASLPEDLFEIPHGYNKRAQ